MTKEKPKEDSPKRKYRSFDLDMMEERKLLILAAHRGYTSTRAFIRVLIDEALQKAADEGFFSNLTEETEKKS